MRAGQAYLPEFRADYNRRFARPARNAFDAHRAVHEELDEILTIQEQRRVSTNLTLTHKRILYVLEDTVEHRRLRGHRGAVHEHEDGTIAIRYAGRVLPHRAHAKTRPRSPQAQSSSTSGCARRSSGLPDDSVNAISNGLRTGTDAATEAADSNGCRATGLATGRDSRTF